MENNGEQCTGGRGGIRTHGTLAGTPVFKTGALNHSATLPFPDASGLAKRAGMRKGQLTARPLLNVATQAPDRSKRSVNGFR